ncbi:AMP-binding protein [Pseudomaricurvus alkylphenolicus]|uniref:fatty acid CoA ligase family protein n=1 Tax=Pseudomaricurvus alkylphenolicus TaxID=1306991 RepID=UPI0014216FAC|nr:AMP-binding protein [Pseudomaricurvus alkylphenolicus]
MSKLTQSYLCGEAKAPLLYETIGNCFDRIADTFPDREALVVRHQGIRWNYRQYRQEVELLATGLLRLGIGPGDRVGIWAPNCYEWCLTQFATAKIGAVMVCINPAYRLYELEYALNKVGCRALITAEQFKTSEYLSMLQELAPELQQCQPGRLKAERLPHLEMVIRMGEEQTSGMLNFPEVCALGTEEDMQRLQQLKGELQPDDAINIQFTSGTTGSPKGATLTHCNILNNGYQVAQGMGFSERDRLCVPVPLYHCFGMVMGNLACITHGAAAIFPNDAFEPLTVLQTVQEERCTALHGVPTMFITELEHPQFGEFDLSSLRTGIMAGAPCPVEVMKRVINDMHMSEVTIMYGQTETSPVNHMTALDDPIDKRVGTVGRCGPHQEIKIIDENGRVVPIGEKGELCCRGYSVMLGYWDDEEKTAETIDAAGWLHSGDLAIMDAEGYVQIVGRLKDMIIRGGENVYPREVEEFLYTHSAIQEVQVFGIPDEKYGEEICAWVQVKEGSSLTPEEVKGYCKDKITHFKVPRHIRLVEEYPMTVTGKIQKFKMREAMLAELE